MATNPNATILGVSTAGIFVIIAAVSGWCLWIRRRKAKKSVEQPREMEVLQAGTREPSNEPENYYATMRPKTPTRAKPTQSNALDDSTYIYENKIYTSQPKSVMIVLTFMQIRKIIHLSKIYITLL